MRALSFILQRSFARYVALDLMSAARGAGWGTAWMDLEGRLLTLSGRPEAERAAGLAELVDELRACDPRVVFSYGLEYLAPAFAVLDPADRRSVSSLVDRPAVYFFFDFGFPFDRPIDAETRPIIETLQGPDSLVFCWDHNAVAVTRSYGIEHVEHFPMAVNPDIFGAALPADGSGRDLPIVFAGGPSPERVSTLRGIADLGLHVYGYDREGWLSEPALLDAWHPAVFERRDMAAIYGRARLAVNVTRPHGPSSLNMRVFEAMASGCLLLTDDRADVHALFVEGKHLGVYRSPEDLRRQSIGFLNDEAARQRIAEAGRARVRADHTYDTRIRTALPRLEQFVREAMVFRRLRDYERSDAGKALAFVAFLEANAPIALHRDTLAGIRARCLDRTGDRAGARTVLQAAVAAHPASLALQRTARDLGMPEFVNGGETSCER